MIRDLEAPPLFATADLSGHEITHWAGLVFVVLHSLHRDT